ncbi:hypothetical protein BH24ACT15_BH24ACT15_15790 [soil metagenome]
MTDSARPSTHALIANLPDTPAAEAAIAEVSREVGIDPADVTHGTGDSFAQRLENTDSDDGAATRVVKWLSSLGQEREELVRLGQAAREGRHAVVIHDVSGRPTVDAITAVLKRHDAEDIVYFGDWQTEDLSIRR